MLDGAVLKQCGSTDIDEDTKPVYPEKVDGTRV